MLVIDGYVGRLFEFAVSAAVAHPAETLHHIAIKVHHKNQVAWRIREINVLPFAINGDARRTRILRLAAEVPDIRQESTVGIEDNNESTFGVGNVDIVGGIDRTPLGFLKRRSLPQTMRNDVFPLRSSTCNAFAAGSLMISRWCESVTTCRGAYRTLGCP